MGAPLPKVPPTEPGPSKAMSSVGKSVDNEAWTAPRNYFASATDKPSGVQPYIQRCLCLHLSLGMPLSARGILRMIDEFQTPNCKRHQCPCLHGSISYALNHEGRKASRSGQLVLRRRLSPSPWSLPSQATAHKRKNALHAREFNTWAPKHLRVHHTMQLEDVTS